MPLPEVVTAAFTVAGLPVPSSERVDRLGYSAEELTVIEREMKRRRRAECDD